MLKNRMSDNCSVCQDIFKNPKLLTCGHTFCKKCIDNIIKSQRKGDIKCPLCQEITKRPKSGATGLMDNFYAEDRRHSSKIIRCKECNKITRNKTCKVCCTNLCEKCIFAHMELKCGAIMIQTSRVGSETQSDEESSPDEDRIIGLEGHLMSEMIHSNFCFELVNKIVVPNLFQNDYDHLLDINLSRISCLNGRKCIVIPNGDPLILIYDENGKEFHRKFINKIVFNVTGGLTGHPLMIESGSSLIYEYLFGKMRQLIWSIPLVPYDLSSLSDGRIVLVGRVKERTIQGEEAEGHGAMRIYEYQGQMVSEVVKNKGEYIFKFPRHVCVNMQNNDIYVGDIWKRQVMHFRENGTLLSLYERAEMVNIDLGGGITSEHIRRSSQFPLSLTYSQHSDLVFASYVSPVDRSIHVLSPCLELLGFFSSCDDIGNPAGMSCDQSGKLYVGDNADGIIRVFKLSQFINRL